MSLPAESWNPFTAAPVFTLEQECQTHLPVWCKPGLQAGRMVQGWPHRPVPPPMLAPVHAVPVLARPAGRAPASWVFGCSCRDKPQCRCWCFHLAALSMVAAQPLGKSYSVGVPAAPREQTQYRRCLATTMGTNCGAAGAPVLQVCQTFDCH